MLWHRFWRKKKSVSVKHWGGLLFNVRERRTIVSEKDREKGQTGGEVETLRASI